MPNGAQGWDWSNLVENVHYTNTLGQITILTGDGGRQIIRVGFIPE